MEEEISLFDSIYLSMEDSIESKDTEDVDLLTSSSLKEIDINIDSPSFGF